ITIFFIFIVLVIVFKSPIVPIISLLTVGVSFITSFSIVTNLVEKFNFPFSNFTQVFMVIVLFGIGTDYNILLYDKFKENLSKGMSNHEATNDALRKAGKTILYSGSSILIGFSALGLANFSIRSEEHTSELQSRFDLVCRLLLEKKKNKQIQYYNT